MINGIISVVVIFLIFSVGFLFTLKKLWPDGTPHVLSVLVVKIAAPALAVISIYDRLTPELLRSSGVLILASALYISIMYLLGKLLSRLLKLKGGKRTVFGVHFTFTNVLFIGLPVNEIVFGREGLPFIFTMYLVTISTFWSLGAWELAKASPLHPKGVSLKKIFSPGLAGVIIGALLVELQIPLPVILDTALRHLSSLCTPLSLLIIGANLVIFSNGIPRLTKDEVMMMLGKFLISPALMFGILKVLGVSGMAMQVLMLTAAMPCHMQTSILAQYYDVEGEYAARLTGLSVLACLFTIPVWVTVLQQPFFF